MNMQALGGKSIHYVSLLCVEACTCTVILAWKLNLIFHCPFEICGPMTPFTNQHHPQIRMFRTEVAKIIQFSCRFAFLASAFL